MRGADCAEVQAGGYPFPPAGFELPPADVMVAPEFTWPDVDLPPHGFATTRTSVPEWLELNQTAGIFNGVANPGAATLAVEVETSVPNSVPARVAS